MSNKNIHLLNLSTIDVPQIKENVRNHLVEFGKDNLLPSEFANTLQYSSIHNAIVIQKAKAIVGDKVITNESPKGLSAWEAFEKNPNFEDDDFNDLLNKISLDLETYGAFCLEVIWSKDGETITELNHIDCSNIRIGDISEGKVVNYQYKEDWSKKNEKASVIPKFDPGTAKQDKRQILYIFNYTPGTKYYGVPQWNPAFTWLKVDGSLGTFHLANIENGMNPSVHIRIKSIPEPEERDELVTNLKADYTGASNAGKIFVTFSNGTEDAADIEPIQATDLDKVYILLNDLIIQNILSAHRLSSPLLLGIKVAGQLGATNEISTSWEIFEKTVISPERNKILKTFNNKLMPYITGDPDFKIDIETSSLIGQQFSENILKEIMTKNELRESIGLGPIEEDQQTQDTTTENNQEGS